MEWYRDNHYSLARGREGGDYGGKGCRRGVDGFCLGDVRMQTKNVYDHGGALINKPSIDFEEGYAYMMLRVP